MFIISNIGRPPIKKPIANMFQYCVLRNIVKFCLTQVFQ